MNKIQLNKDASISKDSGKEGGNKEANKENADEVSNLIVGEPLRILIK